MNAAVRGVLATLIQRATAAFAAGFATGFAAASTEQTCSQPFTPLQPFSPLAAPLAPESMNPRITSLATFSRPGLSAVEKLRITIVSDDADVSRAAHGAQEQLRLLVDACVHNLIAAAIDRAGGTLSSVEPSTVVRALEDITREIGAEVRAVKEEGATHRDVRLQSYSIIQPLRSAVSAQCGAAIQERDTLRRRIDALERPMPNDGAYRTAKLVEMGLALEQIAALGFEKADLDRQGFITTARERITVLDGQITRMKAFCGDPYRDPAHLAGLDGFADFIEAQRAALGEQEAA
jgi:hypothetical protein